MPHPTVGAGSSNIESILPQPQIRDLNLGLPHPRPPTTQLESLSFFLYPNIFPTKDLWKPIHLHETFYLCKVF